MSLTEQEIRRYARHIVMPEIGGRGQKRLLESSVLIAGLGSAGSAAALYLTAAGVGRIRLWDPEPLREEDLGSAIAHARDRIGRSRAESARESLVAINPDADVAVLPPDGLLDAVEGQQVVVATMGDWEALQARAIAAGAAAVFAGVSRGSGAVLAWRPGEPCLGCVDPGAAASVGLEPEGKEGAVAAAGGVIGVVAATEAVKHIIGIGDPLTGRLLAYDGWEARFREVPVTRRQGCRLCGKV